MSDATATIEAGWVFLNGWDHYFKEGETTSVCGKAISSCSQRLPKMPRRRFICERCRELSKPYGYLVTYERRRGYGAVETEQASFRSKGTEARARRAALFKPFFVRIVEVDPYTRDQWLRVFGEGRM